MFFPVWQVMVLMEIKSFAKFWISRISRISTFSFYLLTKKGICIILYLRILFLNIHEMTFRTYQVIRPTKSTLLYCIQNKFNPGIFLVYSIYINLNCIIVGICFSNLIAVPIYHTAAFKGQDLITCQGCIKGQNLMIRQDQLES